MAILGNGTTLGHNTASTGTFTAVANVFSVVTPEVKTEQVKVSHYGTTGGFHAYIPGWKDGGEVTFECNYDKTEYATLDTIQQAGTSLYWKITLPDGATSVFQGFLDTIGITIPNEDKMTHKGVIKVTTQPVFTPGS